MKNRNIETVFETDPYYGGYRLNQNADILDSFVRSMLNNNTFCPNVTKVLYEDKKELTTVSFADGTWTNVHLSKGDDNDLTVAVLYALLKRMMGKPNKSGYVEGNGFMGKLKEIVNNAVTPEKIEKEKEERIKAKKAADAKAHEEAVRRKKAHPSIGGRLRDLEDKFGRMCELFEKNMKHK